VTLTISQANPRDAQFIAAQNLPLRDALDSDYHALGQALERRGVAIDQVTKAVAGFSVAIPSWGVGTGGTRFARFPGRPGRILDWETMRLSTRSREPINRLTSESRLRRALIASFN